MSQINNWVALESIRIQLNENIEQLWSPGTANGIWETTEIFDIEILNQWNYI